VPNYTCVETVTRNYFEPAGISLPRACGVILEQRKHRTLDLQLQPYSSDRLRLDVTMSGRGEIFSWVGASQFEDRGIDHVVKSGPMSSGSFAGYLTAVFATDVKTKMTFDGSKTVDGRMVLQYSFQVPVTASHYQIRVRDSWQHTDYSGSIEVDAETADVLRMRIVSGEFPVASGICQATSTMDFTLIRIGDAAFLLPRTANHHYVYPTAEEIETTTVFANCREFHGESKLSFGPDEGEAGGGAAGGSSKKKVVQKIYPPVGAIFKMTLTKAIATDTAAAGDTFSAKLAEPLRDYRGNIMLPKGTPIEGHILRVVRYVKPAEALVVLKPEAFRVHGETVGITAVRDWRRLMAESQKKGKKGMEILVPGKGESATNSFRFPGDHVVVPGGFLSDWRLTFHTYD
jgi:hypothetical protein